MIKILQQMSVWSELKCWDQSQKALNKSQVEDLSFYKCPLVVMMGELHGKQLFLTVYI